MTVFNRGNILVIFANNAYYVYHKGFFIDKYKDKQLAIARGKKIFFKQSFKY